MKVSTFDFGKKVLLVLAIICFALGLATQGCSRGGGASSYSMTDDFGDIKWPTSGIATLLPEPESKYGKIMNDSATSFNAYIGNTSKSQFDDYIDKCMENGFTVDYNKGSTTFSASDAENNDLSLFFDDDESYMTISLSKQTSSSSAAVSASESSSAVDSAQTTTGEPTATDDTPVNGIRPSFKEAMDSYEQFFDEYCAFMQKYSSSGSPISMAAEYAKFMAQYTETMDKLDAIGEEDLSEQELAYYTEVMGRINQKLADTATAM